MTRPTIASAVGRSALGPLLIAAVLSLALLAGCEKKDASSGPTSADAVIAEVNKTEDAQIAAINGRDIDGATGVYAADAVVIVPNEPAHTTNADIRSSFQTMMMDPASAVKKTNGKRWVSAGGDMVVSTNDFDLTYTDPKTGKPATAPMSTQTSWQKQADGSWKIIADYNVMLPNRKG